MREREGPSRNSGPLRIHAHPPSLPDAPLYQEEVSGAHAIGTRSEEQEENLAT